MPTTPSLPRLVELDPWLSPYADEIRARGVKAAAVRDTLVEEFGSFSAATRIHQQLGFHYDAEAQRWTYREWAPQARGLSLIGDFNDWERDAHPLTRNDAGIWEIALPGDRLQHGQRVKVHVHGADGSRQDRIPACITRTVQDPESHDFAGQIWHPPSRFQFEHDFQIPTGQAPVIYEAHIGMAGEEPRLHSYAEFTEQVLPRIAAGGYNTIQLMAVQEHPYYGSFGYHVSSFFAASSRFGTPEELKLLIDTAHGHGLAVLLDVVHSHAVKNTAEGLANFDGSGALYFHPGDHPQWDSKCFDYGKPEVLAFLLSNLRYWLEEFHFDGFRFDGVTSMLYHHHGLTSFDHYDRYFGEEVNTAALAYLSLATDLCKSLRRDCLLVAEDMSGMPGLCRPSNEGGIGFDYRLAMGIPDFWIKLLKHQRDEDWPVQEIWQTLSNRRAHEKSIAYAESHDQALVGDKTLAFRLMDQDMYWHMGKGSENPVIDRGIALHKILRLITMSLGGEGYLNFIGNEFGHPEWVDFPREGNQWSYQYCRRQWSLADNDELRYEALLAFDQAMIELLRSHAVLESAPAIPMHFDQHNQVLIASRADLIFAFNLSPEQSIPDYRFPCPEDGCYQVLLDSDAEDFGGHARLDRQTRHHSLPGPTGRELSIYLPNRTALVLGKID